MIKLVPMTELVFEEFKRTSQLGYATNLATVEGILVEDGLKNASEQFARLVPDGLKTSDQFFFEAIEEKSEKSIGYLWLGVQNRLGRKVASINDISIKVPHRGQGFGKALMACVEQEAKKLGAQRIRLHVFQFNEIARKLYLSMGFQVSSLDMFKLLHPN